MRILTWVGDGVGTSAASVAVPRRFPISYSPTRAQTERFEPPAELLGAPPHHRREHAEVVVADREHLAVEVLALQLDRRGVAGDHGRVVVVDLVQPHEVDREALAGRDRGLGEVDVDVVVAPREELVGGHAIELREPEEPGHRDGTLTPLVRAEHRRFELLVRPRLDVVQRQALLAADRAQPFPDVPFVHGPLDPVLAHCGAGYPPTPWLARYEPGYPARRRSLACGRTRAEYQEGCGSTTLRVR